MSRPMKQKTLGIIHAIHKTIKAMEPFIEKYIPEVDVMHLADDTIQRDNIAAGVGVIPKSIITNLLSMLTTWKRPAWI